MTCLVLSKVRMKWRLRTYQCFQFDDHGLQEVWSGNQRRDSVINVIRKKNEWPASLNIFIRQKLASLDISQLSIQSISTKYVYLPHTSPQECPPPWPEFDCSMLMSMMYDAGGWRWKFKKSTFSRPKLIRETKDNMKMSDWGYKRSHCDTFYTEESLNCSSSFPQRKHGNTKIFSFIKTLYPVLSLSFVNNESAKYKG